MLEENANLQRRLKEFQENVTSHLEMLAAAYMKATNIPPEECELVVETLPNKTVYRFQRRPTQAAPDASERCDHGNPRGKCYVETCGFSKPAQVS